MRIPVSWLRSYCDPGLPAEEIADALTQAGDKLERLHRTGVGDTSAFLTGRVLASEQHPNADRLNVNEVDIGRGEPQTIVTGAPNVAAGQTVAVALPGAVMPDGSTLGEAKLRGVASAGMILAEDEVGIGEDHDGIMVLAEGLPIGAPLADHLPIADEVLELEITPNRPDIMGVYGVARDLHAVTGAPLAEDPTEADAEPSGSDSVDDHAAVEIDPEICLRFTARVFEDVKIGPSPLWLKQRLMAAGQRPISNVVDITNYVMLATSSAAPRVRPRRGARLADHRAACGGGGDDDDARRGRASLQLGGGARLRRRGAQRHRGDHGRPDLRGVGAHDARADGGRNLGRARTSCARRRRSACAPRHRRGSRSSSTPSRRSRRSGWRRGSWSSSAARGWCRARSTCTRTPPSRGSSGCARNAWSGYWGRASRRRA